MSSLRKYNVSVGGRTHEVEFVSKLGSEITFRTGGKEYTVEISTDNATQSQSFLASTPSSSTGAASPATPSSDSPHVIAPMPGLVVSIAAKEGDKVSAGDQALVLEAMKMENAVPFGRDGKVKKILVKPNDQVEASQVLIELE